LAQGVLLTRASRLRGQETFEPAPSLKIMISSAFTKKEVEKAGGIVKASLIKCLGSELESSNFFRDQEVNRWLKRSMFLHRETLRRAWRLSSVFFQGYFHFI
jgi:hypothetical protein